MSMLPSVGVPAFRKLNQWPSQFVVVRGFRRWAKGRGMGRDVQLRCRCKRRSHGIQHSIEFNFSLRVLELGARRSEEHTSELQSRFDLVCRLLLEKKKKRK